ncbi:MAG TPA: hypothetical protein PL185_04330 [Flavobacteriales bacterium]|nr:hypothetical protein [Flavobacteriales bacterium]HPH81770.1 hypothetical protein [Flavobacteriales bacterium]
MKRISSLLLALCSLGASAQIITREDSLHAGLTPSTNPTVISGYGQFKAEYDTRYQTAKASLTRNVLFFGHKFNKRIAFFSEMELEDAKVVGGSPSGEISMEQMFLKFGINNDIYLTAGLFIPRIGLVNENHLPTIFNGNDRPFVERLLIPSTWRELGVSLYGRSRRIPGLNYSAGIMNGLNSQGFGNGEGIREGRFEGNNATAGNLAVTGALLYYRQGFRFQASAYYGGSAGLVKRVADSLQLDSRPFGTPVFLTEANVQYQSQSGFEFKVLGTLSTIKDAASINRAYSNNTPGKMWGAYAEIGYNILKAFKPNTERSLVLFARAEAMDLNAEVPFNGIHNPEQNKQFFITGITYTPVRGVVVKVDYVHRMTGTPNPALILTPYPSALPYFNSNGFLNIGAGYSF